MDDMEELRLLDVACELTDHLLSVLESIGDYSKFMAKNQDSMAQVIKRYYDPLSASYLGLGSIKLGEAMLLLKEHIDRQVINLEAEKILMQVED